MTSEVLQYNVTRILRSRKIERARDRDNHNIPLEQSGGYSVNRS